MLELLCSHFKFRKPALLAFKFFLIKPVALDSISNVNTLVSANNKLIFNFYSFLITQIGNGEHFNDDIRNDSDRLMKNTLISIFRFPENIFKISSVITIIMMLLILR